MDAKALLRAQKAAAKVQHPYASYNASGQLRCVVCAVPGEFTSLPSFCPSVSPLCSSPGCGELRWYRVQLTKQLSNGTRICSRNSTDRARSVRRLRRLSEPLPLRSGNRPPSRNRRLLSGSVCRSRNLRPTTMGHHFQLASSRQGTSQMSRTRMLRWKLPPHRQNRRRRVMPSSMPSSPL